jgi:hypothetical protein
MSGESEEVLRRLTTTIPIELKLFYKSKFVLSQARNCTVHHSKLLLDSSHRKMPW